MGRWRQNVEDCSTETHVHEIVIINPSPANVENRVS
jgi:hypothetical protein